jgi:hypothetical protein
MNTAPIFPLTPSIQWGATALATANTAKDGTGTVLTVFTADATNGSRVDYLKSRAIGSNIATVLRLFINNGATNATPANNVLFMERTIAATTLSEVAELADVYIPLDISLPAGYKVNATVGTTIAAGIMLAGVGGTY